MTLAPVYDCGSSLYPQADEKIMETVLASEQDMNYRIFEIPYLCHHGEWEEDQVF